MPEQIAVAFEVVAAEVEVNDFVAALAVPVHEKGNFALAGGMAHVTGDSEFAYARMVPDEALIGGEDHVLEAGGGIDSFDLVSALLQNTTEGLPLGAGFLAVDWGISRHVGVFVVDDIEKGGRTEQNLPGHLRRS